MKLKSLALCAAIVAVGSACTPEEIEIWSGWWEDDPSAAEDFAHQEWVQRSLINGCNSYCDVDDPALQQPESSDESSESSSSGNEDDGSDGQEGQDTAGVYEPWISLANCESGGNWHIDTGNGYYGGLQFAWGSWEAAGGSGNPAHASPSEQVMRGEILQDMQGWGAWPTCARAIGLL